MISSISITESKLDEELEDKDNFKFSKIATIERVLIWVKDEAKTEVVGVSVANLVRSELENQSVVVLLVSVIVLLVSVVVEDVSVLVLLVSVVEMLVSVVVEDVSVVVLLVSVVELLVSVVVENV